ncbi:Nramp family divalent metal transporter [Exiguobacterium sp. KKBO11]|uniref:Nramp family divalent metal transporter n=1 Tax=Exiguobacterium sp. KKBO11 TaxID=1805000 RepID=UPI0009EEFE1D|nr:Nramp family divalent metal transporter [Exiguobacterium sp. KKBO11]
MKTKSEVNEMATQPLTQDLPKKRTYIGPAFVAAVAYLDPGNFATNMTAGAQYGYLLLWVIVASNLMAVVIQFLSAKLGIVSNLSLAEVIREELSPVSRFFYWVQAELVAMATDLAEFVGAALGFHLLFAIDLRMAALLTAILSFVILGFEQKGLRHFEAVIAVLVLIIAAAFAIEVFEVHPVFRDLSAGLLPGFEGTSSIVLAAGMLGATVMPHAIYLHSDLTKRRMGHVANKLSMLRIQRFDIWGAMLIAGAVNGAMLVIAASVFYGTTYQAGSLEAIYEGLHVTLGGIAPYLFAIALLVSGLASSSVGTMSGDAIMRGFLHLQLPLFVRRTVTMLPAIVLLFSGFDPTRALVLSQVALSFGIPFALIPLIRATASERYMGEHRNSRFMNALAWVIVSIVIVFNIYLLVDVLV